MSEFINRFILHKLHSSQNVQIQTVIAHGAQTDPHLQHGHAKNKPERYIKMLITFTLI